MVDPLGQSAGCPVFAECYTGEDGTTRYIDPASGEEIIYLGEADSGVKDERGSIVHEDGSRTMTNDQATQQQRENRNKFYLNNIFAGIGHGVGKLFSKLGGLFGSGASQAETAIANGVTRSMLQTAANDPGSTVRVVTNLTQAPQTGRALSVAVGEGAENLASTARSGGRIFTANIPKALIENLKTAGLVEERITMMGGAKGTELYFRPEAAEFIVKFFR